MIKSNAKSYEFAEFMGALIGDGFIGSYGRSTKIIQITGNRTNDREYYDNHLIPLIEKLFDVNINLYEKDNWLRLTLYSKPIFNLLKHQYNFPVGKKEEIEIPKGVILDDACRIGFLRGLFDTDGSIHLQRQRYPVIAITTTSKTLAYQVLEIMNYLKFGAYICHSKGKQKDAYRVTIFGKQKVLKWKNLISSSNPYHLKRINASVA